MVAKENSNSVPGGTADSVQGGSTQAHSLAQLAHMAQLAHQVAQMKRKLPQGRKTSFINFTNSAPNGSAQSILDDHMVADAHPWGGARPLGS